MSELELEGRLFATGAPTSGALTEALESAAPLKCAAAASEASPPGPPAPAGASGSAAAEKTRAPHLSFKDAKQQLLERFEREYLLQLLRRCEGNLARAARESGLHRKSIERLVSRYQLDPRRMRRSAR
jgi:DNA-binding NtrC family response regulator